MKIVCPHCHNAIQAMQELVDESDEYRVYFCTCCSRKYAKRIVKEQK